MSLQEYYMMPWTLRDSSVDAIAERLTATRKAFGLTQLEFAAGASIPGNTYNQYERAKSRPNLSFGIQLCETYGLTLDWIYFGDPRGLDFETGNRILANLPPEARQAYRPHWLQLQPKSEM